MLFNIFWATAQTGRHVSVSSTDQAKNAKHNTFCCYGWMANCWSFRNRIGLRLHLFSFVSMIVVTRALFANNEMWSAVSTEFERSKYLAKVNYHPNTWRGAPRGAGPPETRAPQRRGAQCNRIGCISLRPALPRGTCTPGWEHLV